MIHQFAVEYASKCLLRPSTNGVTSPSSLLSETSEGPLDLTVNRTLEVKQSKAESGKKSRKYRCTSSSFASPKQIYKLV